MMPGLYGSQKLLPTVDPVTANKWKTQTSQAGGRRMPQPSDLKVLPERRNCHTRSLLDIEHLKSILQKKDEDSIPKNKPERLPPLLSKPTETPSVCNVKWEKGAAYRSVKEAVSFVKTKEHLDPIIIAGKSLSYQPPSPKPRSRLNFPFPRPLKLSTKSQEIHHRSRSIDLQQTHICTFESSINESNICSTLDTEVVKCVLEDSISPIEMLDLPMQKVCRCVRQNDRLAGLQYKQFFAEGGGFPGFTRLQTIYRNGDLEAGRRQVIGFHFEGVLGDYYKRCWTDTSPKSLRVRKNCLVGLQWLKHTFQLVLITALPRRKTLRILTYFRRNHIYFSAVYTATSKTIDYAPLLADLQVSWQDVLVVSSIDLSYEDLEEISEETVCVRMGGKRRLVANGLAVSEGNAPVVMLVPSMVAQSNEDLLPFDIIASAIQSFRKSSHFSDDFTRLLLSPTPDMTPLLTSIIHQIALSELLPPPKAASVRATALCEVHRTPTLSVPGDFKRTKVIIMGQRPAAYNTKPGCEVVETKALRLKSGYLNLLNYTSEEMQTLKPAAVLSEHI